MKISAVLWTLLPMSLLLALSACARPAFALAVVPGSTREYGGHTYELLTPSSWTDAETYAESLGGHLVVIDNAAENQWVWDTFSTLKTSDFLWIGLFQPPGSPEPAGGWQWVDGTPLTYTDWNTGEPNNQGDENSGMMFYSTTVGGPAWNDGADNFWGSPQGVVEFGSGAAPGERVVEAWRSPYGAGRSVAVDPNDGSAWAAMGVGVMHVSAAGTILAQIDSFIGPYAVALNAADGSCWVADAGAGEVVHLSAKGEELWRGTTFTEPVSVAVNPADGSCWVADAGTYDDTTGLYTGGIVVHLSVNGEVLWKGTDYLSPQSVSVNPADGSCWIADATGPFISHVAADGTELWWGGSFLQPVAVSVNPSDGSCWVGDLGSWNDTTQTMTGGCVAHLSSTGTELWRGGPVSVGSVAADPKDGSCWAADMMDNVLVHVSAAGAVLVQNTDEAGPSAEAVNPTDESCWVTTYASGKLLHFTAAGVQLWEGQGFSYPLSVSVNSHDGSCWVADGSSVAHLAADGSELWRDRGIQWSWSASVDPTTGACWVVDPGTDVKTPPQLVQFSAAGTELQRISGFSTLLLLSADPTDGSCWVADGAGVAHVSSAGATLWSTVPFTTATMVSANTTDGSCWVVDRGVKQIVHLASHGTELWRGAAGTSPLTVAVNSADGSCWETDDSDTPQVAHVSEAGEVLWKGTDQLPLWWAAPNPTDGSCWVGDEYDVMHLSVDGDQLWMGNHFYEPAQLSVNAADGSCWVADSANGQVVHLVLLPPITPTAAFTATPTTGAAPLTVTFTDQSVGAHSGWEWVFGDGGTSTQPNPTHTYAAAGSYTVRLTVSNGSATDTLTKKDYIVVSPPPAPVANFVASPTSGVAPLAVQFTDASLNSPTSWAWSFGDGTTASTRSPSHTYNNAGDYTVSLTATNAGGSDTEIKDDCITARFTDVAADFWAYPQVMACVDAGLVTGYPGDLYGPDLEVTRDQMAVYISRALAGGDAKVPTPPATASFTDVPTSYWAYKYVEYAKNEGIVSGYTPTQYAPTLPVTRDQMAVFIARSIVTPTGEAGMAGYTPPSTPSFPDVSTSYWAYKYIEYIKSKDITGGYPDGLYHPEIVVTRDQMAVYIARAFKLMP